jgi:hypothetical protein
LVILSPASSAIEVRTVIGRVPAALTAFRGRAGAEHDRMITDNPG